MKTIHKYLLDHSNQCIEMPKDAIILSVDNQFKQLCIWVEVETNNETEPRYFNQFETGQAIPVDIGVKRIFLGTVQFNNGTYILHVYENIGI